MDAPEGGAPVSKLATTGEAIAVDGAEAGWDFWLRRLYLETLTEFDRRRLN